MDRLFCSITAFQLLRMPPIAFAYPKGEGDLAPRGGMRKMCRAERPLGALDKPLHILVDDRRRSFRTPNIITHVRDLAAFPNQTLELAEGVHVTSPLLTLLTMAPDISTIELAMAMNELCGSYAVFSPDDGLRSWLQALADSGRLPAIDGWRPVRDRQGRLTDLWSRPPLLHAGAITRFAEGISGLEGCKRFAQAAGLVFDNAASPLETQAAMRLGVPRRWGGAGFDRLRLNPRIQLDRSARLISGKSVCYADALLENPERTKSVIVECQSALIHDSRESALDDATRLAALQSMGYLVVPVTYAQLSDELVFRQIAAHIARELGVPLRPKTPALLARERELCRYLFLDWARLGR